jgi:hypothetical protein
MHYLHQPHLRDCSAYYKTYHKQLLRSGNISRQPHLQPLENLLRSPYQMTQLYYGVAYLKYLH